MFRKKNLIDIHNICRQNEFNFNTIIKICLTRPCDISYPCTSLYVKIKRKVLEKKNDLTIATSKKNNASKKKK